MDLQLARTSVADSILQGEPFSLAALDTLLEAALATAGSNRGALGDGTGFIDLPTFDRAGRRANTLERIRKVAIKAGQETVYYQRLFGHLGLDPATLSWAEFAGLPLTPKAALRDNPYDFVAASSNVAYITTSTGTTGRPTEVAFAAREIRALQTLDAIYNAQLGDLLPADIVLWTTPMRGFLGALTGTGGMMSVSNTSLVVGLWDPAFTLQLLSERRRLPGKAERVNIFIAYPSYLGDVVETGLRLGYGPDDFGLRLMNVGGEITTAGLRRRATQLFGEVPWFDGYGMTETWGSGGADCCDDGHLHFGENGAHWEFLDPDSGQPAEPGGLATLVATPLLPFRETTLLLRYDTEDLVHLLSEPPTCAAGGDRPVTSGILGKKALSVRHDQGWTFPRQLLEALEDLDAVPLPARFGFRAAPGGVSVEVVVRDSSASTRRAVADALADQGVPVAEATLWTDRAQLQHPYPLRGDQREAVLTPT